MSILKHSSSEYYITMRDDTDLDSLDYGLDKLCDDEIIIDWDNNEFESETIKEIHIYLDVDKDTEENWRTIGNTLGMSLDDLHTAKKPMTRIYCGDFKAIPKGSLWNKPLPGAKEVKDYHGSMITLSRLDQLHEDEESFLGCDWLDECLLFYLPADEDTTELQQKIESLLLQTKEA